MAVDLVSKTAKMGVAPLALEYFRIRQIADNQPVGLCSVLRVNSIELGTLYPEQYQPVVNRNAQCIKLASWSFRTAVQDLTAWLNEGRFEGYVTLYLPLKLLMKPEFDKLLAEVPEERRTIFSHLVFELSAEVLLSDTAALAERMKSLKQAFGLRFLISHFGDPYCPVLRLEGLPFDIAALDRSLSDKDAILSARASTAIKLSGELSMDTVFVATEDATLTEQALVAGCGFYRDVQPLVASEVIG